MGRRDPSAKRNDMLISSLKKKIGGYDRTIARETAKLRNLDPEAGDGDAGAGEEQEESVIQIWAHDITIEPGRTYRYRFTVELYNPFFARKLDLIKEQHDLAESITLASQTSEWSMAEEAIPRLKV